MIHVCAMTRVVETVENAGAAHLVSLLNAGTPFERPGAIAKANHLVLSMNDIVQQQDGFVAPGVHHVETLLAFVNAWDRATPLVINCFAGISRSTAAAYIAIAALAPSRDEQEIALTLRRLSPSATPNAMLIAHADAILGRNGRMVKAIRSIGRGTDAFEGNPFAMMLKP